MFSRYDDDDRYKHEDFDNILDETELDSMKEFLNKYMKKEEKTVLTKKLDKDEKIDKSVGDKEIEFKFDLPKLPVYKNMFTKFGEN